MKRLEKNNRLWYIYPISGLQIEHQENIDEFIFKDATVAIYEDLISYFKSIKFGLSDKERNEYLLLLRKHEGKSLLIVEIYHTYSHNIREKLQSEALTRAKQITSLIYFCYLYTKDLRYAISLSSEVYNLSPLETNHISASGSFSDTQAIKDKGMISQVPIPDIKVTHYELKAIFKKHQFQPIYSIVNEKSCDLTLNALVFFYDTSHTPSNISQTLGAYVALEILFKGNKSYDETEKVLKLILDNQYDQFLTKKNKKNKKVKDNPNKKDLKIFNLRHDIVHEGRMPTLDDAYRIVRLFTQVLVLYGHYYEIYKSNSKLNSYLKLFADLTYNDTLKQDIHFMLPAWEKIKYDVTNLDQD